MPLYEYYCKKCDKTVTELKKVSEMNNVPDCECPEGESQMKKIIFSTGLKMVGKGFYQGGFSPKPATKKNSK